MWDDSNLRAFITDAIRPNVGRSRVAAPNSEKRLLSGRLFDAAAYFVRFYTQVVSSGSRMRFRERKGPFSCPCSDCYSLLAGLESRILKRKAQRCLPVAGGLRPCKAERDNRYSWFVPI